MGLDYIRQSLGEDEELVHIGHFHWMYTFAAILNVLIGIFLAIGIIVAAIMVEPSLPSFLRAEIPADAGWLEKVRAVNPALKILAFFILVMGLFRYARMMIIKVTTEIAITNKRLVFKRGLVARYVGEMSVDRIESVNVLQSVWGRILNYGRLIVHGMGVGEIILPPIEDPIKFRKAIEQARNI